MSAPAADPRHAAGPRAVEPRIGPNAVIQLAQAVRDEHGEPAARHLFARAGLSDYMTTPPTHMVPQSHVQRLFAELTSMPDAGQMLLADAGRRTARYLLAHRIPAFARVLLPRMPRNLAMRLLLRAIRAHAWTFAGSGRLRIVAGPAPALEISDNPLPPSWHAAVFETLLRALVDPTVQVRWRNAGASSRFEIARGPARAPGSAARSTPVAE